MARAGIGPEGLLLRVLGALVLVYATFNPRGTPTSTGRWPR